MTLWGSLLRAVGAQARQIARSPEQRDPELRFVSETQARIRREIEDRRRAQRIEDEASLWEMND